MSKENDPFWSEIGSGFKEAGSTPPPRIPRSTHPWEVNKVHYVKMVNNQLKVCRGKHISLDLDLLNVY